MKGKHLLNVIFLSVIICILTIAGQVIAAPLLPGKDITDTIINPDIDPGVIDNLVFPPKAPSNLKATSPSHGVVKLTWKDNSSNEKGFKIERKSGDDGEWVQVAKEGANATSYQESELSLWPIFPGEKYYYRVRAYHDSAQSSYSNEVSVVVVNIYLPPAAPENLTAQVSADGRVDLKWEDKSNNEKEFIVYSTETNYKWASVPANTESYSIPAGSLTQETPIRLAVKAVNDGGSAASNSVKVIVHVSPPAVPTNVSAKPLTTSSIKLTWQDNSNNEDNFVVRRRMKGETSYSKEPLILPPNTTTVDDTGLLEGTAYYYVVEARNNKGMKISPEIPGNTLPEPPWLTATVVSENAVKLNWYKPSKPDGMYDGGSYFEIYRKDEGGGWGKLTQAFSPCTQEYIDENLTPGKKYYYRMRLWLGAFYDSGYSQDIPVTPSKSALLQVINPGKFTAQPGNMIQVGPEATDSSGGTGDLTGTLQMKKVITLSLGQKTYMVNQETRQMDAPPAIVEGRTLLPVKSLADALGADLSWDSSAKKATVSLDGTVIELWIGKNTAKVNGKSMMIDPGNGSVTPIIMPPGRTMLPMRFISENLGCTVEWDPVKKQAIISTQ